jgi:hypothetical protein
MMNSRAGSTRFNGKPVNYQGVMSNGSPRGCFGRDLFEPFRFDAAQQSWEWAIDSCRERHLDATEYVSEISALLLAPVKRRLVRLRQEDMS